MAINEALWYMRHDNNQSSIKWPFCCNILDFVHGYVVFDDINDYIHGLENFRNDFKFDPNKISIIGQQLSIEKNDSDNDNCDCIKCIVKIDNSFGHFRDDEFKNDLEFDLLKNCWVTHSLLVKWKNVMLIAQLHFVLACIYDIIAN